MLSAGHVSARIMHRTKDLGKVRMLRTRVHVPTKVHGVDSNSGAPASCSSVTMLAFVIHNVSCCQHTICTLCTLDGSDGMLGTRVLQAVYSGAPAVCQLLSATMSLALSGVVSTRSAPWWKGSGATRAFPTTDSGTVHSCGAVEFQFGRYLEQR